MAEKLTAAATCRGQDKGTTLLRFLQALSPAGRRGRKNRRRWPVSAFSAIFVSKTGGMDFPYDSKLRRNILKATWNAMRDYRMIAPDDHILIGLSGGKDSLLLTDILAEAAASFRPAFTLEAVHVVLKEIPYAVNATYLSDFCRERGVRFHLKEAHADLSGGSGASRKQDNPCFICSWTRRKTLFETAKELGCNKIALGHHLDDVLETLLMNQVFQGSISTVPPVLKMNKFDMTILRPFYRVPEADLQRLAEEAGLTPPDKRCPYEHDSHRAGMKKVMAELERMNPQVRQSMLKAMHNIQKEYLPPENGAQPTVS